MPTLFVLLNHKLNKEQENDAFNSLKISNIIDISAPSWADIPPEAEDISTHILPFIDELSSKAKSGDYLLVQGEFGATFMMVDFAIQNHIIPIYATTKRSVVESTNNGVTTTQRVFSHERYRIYKPFNKI